MNSNNKFLKLKNWMTYYIVLNNTSYEVRFYVILHIDIYLITLVFFIFILVLFSSFYLFTHLCLKSSSDGNINKTYIIYILINWLEHYLYYLFILDLNLYGLKKKIKTLLSLKCRSGCWMWMASICCVC